MFYGKIPLHSSSVESVPLPLSTLKNVMEWEGSIHHGIEFGNFSGGIFLDHRLPLTIRDFLYIDAHQEVLVLMSGCIYNRTEISIKINISADLVSDPMLVANAYLHLGADFVNDLNGDFSILIYQPKKNFFQIYRDHVGIKPLVYCMDHGTLYFSSDIIGLCRTFHNGEKMNMDPVVSTHKCVDTLLTPNEKVLKLKPGHLLEFNSETVTIKKYWEPERIKTDSALTQAEMFSELKSLLEDAVQIRSDQRFKAGAHVSGGLDSSTVAALARKEYPKQNDFYGYSWSPDNYTSKKIKLDERELVRKLGNMANIIPVFLDTQHDDLISSIKNSLFNYMYFYEEKVLIKAQKHKTNLIFSGWGGDEFLSFGSMGLDSDLFFNFQWKTFLKRNPLKNPVTLLKRLIWRVFFPALNIITPSARNSLLESLFFFKKEHQKLDRKTFEKYYCFRSRREYHLNIIYYYHVAERTECWDILGYKYGVQYRYPLLDKRIIEYMLKVPSKLLIKDGDFTRIILREISNDLLPEEIRWRKGKRDDAFFEHAYEPTTIERNLKFMDEVAEFRANPNMSFIDFDLLEHEIKEFRKTRDTQKHLRLRKDIGAIKMFHEYSKAYEKELTQDVNLSVL